MRILYSIILLAQLVTVNAQSRHWEKLRDHLDYQKYVPSEENSGNDSQGGRLSEGMNSSDGIMRGGPSNRSAQKDFYREFIIDENSYLDEGESYLDKEQSIRESKKGWDLNEIRRRSKSSRERAKSESKRKRKRNRSAKDKSQSNEGSTMSTGVAGFLKVLGILLVVGLIAYGLYLYLKNRNPGDHQLNVDAEVSPNEISKTELEKALDQALNDENYRAAIRVYFLFMMKDLSEKGWIRWEQDKTNSRYLTEMRSRPEYKKFERCVFIYEVVWYGNRNISKSDFLSVEPEYKSLLSELGVK